MVNLTFDGVGFMNKCKKFFPKLQSFNKMKSEMSDFI